MLEGDQLQHDAQLNLHPPKPRPLAEIQRGKPPPTAWSPVAFPVRALTTCELWGWGWDVPGVQLLKAGPHCQCPEGALGRGGIMKVDLIMDGTTEGAQPRGSHVDEEEMVGTVGGPS